MYSNRGYLDDISALILVYFYKFKGRFMSQILNGSKFLWVVAKSVAVLLFTIHIQASGHLFHNPSGHCCPLWVGLL